MKQLASISAIVALLSVAIVAARAEEITVNSADALRSAIAQRQARHDYFDCSGRLLRRYALS